MVHIIRSVQEETCALVCLHLCMNNTLPSRNMYSPNEAEYWIPIRRRARAAEKRPFQVQTRRKMPLRKMFLGEAHPNLHGLPGHPDSGSNSTIRYGDRSMPRTTEGSGVHTCGIRNPARPQRCFSSFRENPNEEGEPTESERETTRLRAHSRRNAMILPIRRHRERLRRPEVGKEDRKKLLVRECSFREPGLGR